MKQAKRLRERVEGEKETGERESLGRERRGRGLLEKNTHTIMKRQRMMLMCTERVCERDERVS